MSVGRNLHSTGENEGDRTVNYDQDGKHSTVSLFKKTKPRGSRRE